MRRHPQKAGWWLAGLLLLTLPAAGQLQLGDDLSMKLNGTISGGYGGTYGNLIQSTHSLNFGGEGALTGSYYSPNFLNFNFSPYYNRAGGSSTFQSLTRDSGFTFASGIFSGSHFPGSVSYAKAYNSQGNFGVPGLADFTTHGNSDTFAINWSELVPGLPSLTAGFHEGSSAYSIYGGGGNGSSTNHGFNVQSAYTLAGFNLNANYTNGTSEAAFPELLSGSTQTEKTHMDNNGYGVGVGHLLPLRGQWTANFNRMNMNDDFSGYKFNGTVDTVSTSAGVQPTDKLRATFTSTYSDNLAATLYQSALSSGVVVVAPSNQESSSHSVDLNGTLTYDLLRNLQAQGFVERRMQSFLGQSFGANTYGGGLNFAHALFGGTFNTAGTVSENTIDRNNVKTLGFTTSASYNRRIGAWFIGSSFSYAQNVQTLLITYTNSYYNYSAHVKRRIGGLTWSTGASFAKTGLTAHPGTDSSSQSFSMGLGYKRWVSANGSYSKAHANGLLTATGVTPTPLPPIIPVNLLILYGGTSYSAGLSTSAFRGFTASGSFAHALSNTMNSGAGSWNKTEQYNFIVQYQFRKVYLNGGYARLLQGFSASSTAPGVVSSFSIGVSRWFNFF